MKAMGVVGIVAVVAAGCGGSPDEAKETPATSISTSTSQTTTTSPTESTTSTASPTSAPQQSTPAAPVVSEGAFCTPRGATAGFADGATAYCARLQYTDASAWSRDPSLAPNPEAEASLAQLGPQIGDSCIGADIGRRGTDAAGTAIVCDNYEWRPDVGQRPSHPWVDGQIAWAECLEEFTGEECREMING